MGDDEVTMLSGEKRADTYANSQQLGQHAQDKTLLGEWKLAQTPRPKKLLVTDSYRVKVSLFF